MKFQPIFFIVGSFWVTLFLSCRPIQSWADIVVFDEFTDTISINNHPNLGFEATIEVVIKLDAELGGGMIFNTWRPFQEDKQLTYGESTDRLFGFLNIGSPILVAGPPVENGEWQHFAYVYDGTEERIYIDGELIVSQAASGSIPNGTSSRLTVIGAIDRSTAFPDIFRPSFRGQIESLRISSIARYFGNSITPHYEDFQYDTDAVMIFNFTEPPGNTQVVDIVNGAVGTFGVGFSNATEPEIISDNILGDVNCDGAINLLDVAPFVEAITGKYNFKADINQDGVVDLLDVQPFVDLLTGG